MSPCYDGGFRGFGDFAEILSNSSTQPKLCNVFNRTDVTIQMKPLQQYFCMVQFVSKLTLQSEIWDFSLILLFRTLWSQRVKLSPDVFTMFALFLGFCVVKPSALIPVYLHEPACWDVPGSQSASCILCNHEILSPACYSHCCCHGNWPRCSAAESFCHSSKSVRGSVV